mmetsp:Transcript_281/g.686  ORF Transcript_281/g.686 Transcript_281/m.686 type:complete len:385 (-) Transcript_281:268-1422(-)
MAETSPRTTSKRARKAPKKMSDAADEDDLDAVEEVELQEAIAASQAEAPPPEAPKPKPEIEEGKFYKRELPEQCVAFASREGRAFFESALKSGGLEGFFDLIAQFHTQNEPAYCGLATLTMALNSLKVDPGRPWKGVWRWYDESLLDCCKDLREVQLDGISLEEFVCLAVCNGLSCDTRRAHVAGEDVEMAPTTTSVKTCANVSDGCHASITSGSLDDLRAAVKHACGRSDVVLAASYSRKTLGQTGDGHFSPVGGYDASTDQVLLLDVARFKYPPHWVPLPVLYEAMQRKDPKTLQVRGWCLLSATSSTEGESGDLRAASAILNTITGGKASKHTDLPKPGRKPSAKKGDAPKKPAARKPATTRKRKAAPDVTQCGLGAASVI